MKTTMRNLIIALAICSISVSSAADVINPAETRFLEFTKATPASKEQLESLLFDARIPENAAPPGVLFELHNGLPDYVIIGVIINVSYKDPTTGDQKSIDIYADCGDTLPYSVTSGHVPFFQARQITKLNPHISLKEVRLRNIKG